MLQGNNTYTVKTRKDGDQAKKDAKATALTIDWNGCSEDDVKVLAARQIVITRQQFWRKNGIPTQDKVAAKDFASGARQALTAEVATAFALEAAKTDPKLREALIKQLQGLK